jgi:hypothetical protein
VDERQLRSGGLDGGTVASDGRQRCPAERSTKVTQENQEHRRALLHFSQRRRKRHQAMFA